MATSPPPDQTEAADRQRATIAEEGVMAATTPTEEGGHALHSSSADSGGSNSSADTPTLEWMNLIAEGGGPGGEMIENSHKYGLLEIENFKIPKGPLFSALNSGTFQPPAPAPMSPSASSGGGRVAVGGGAQNRSISMASVASDRSNKSDSEDVQIVDTPEMKSLTSDVKLVTDAFQNLRAVCMINPEDGDLERPETLHVAITELLAEALTVIQTMMVRYPLLQCPPVIQGAAVLIEMVRLPSSELSFYDALDNLAMTFSNRVAGYLTGDLQTEAPPQAILTPEQIDLLLMRHDTGVDQALSAARSWTKYADEVLRYVEKRMQIESECAKKLAKLCQTSRVALKEESYLPFQSVYCAALDDDMDHCGNVHQSYSVLFMQPLTLRTNKLKKLTKTLETQWVKALKNMQERANLLDKASVSWTEKKQDYQRCKEAVRIAEQGAELGATAENKVDKRKRNEEEGRIKLEDAERVLQSNLTQANEHHARLMQIKSNVLRKLREAILEGDQTMKGATVNYFKVQLDLSSNVPVKTQSKLETSRRYEPGSQYMEFVRCHVGNQVSTLNYINPFGFDHQAALRHAMQYEETYGEASLRAQNSVPSRSTADDFSTGTYKLTGERNLSLAGHAGALHAASSGQHGPQLAWPPQGAPTSTAPGTAGAEHCDTDSFDSRDDSADRSKDTSPSASPRVISQRIPSQMSTSVSEDAEALASISAGPRLNTTKVTPSLGAMTHRFKKTRQPAKCRECDGYIYFEPYTCQDCQLSSHKKCLEFQLLFCGHKRMPRKIPTFGVDIGSYLLDAGCQVPPVVVRCVYEIEQRGIDVKGVYRISGAARKVDRLCHAFDIAAELVELSDITPSVVGNVLKKYLQRLPEPLIVFALYSEFLRVAKSCPNVTESSPPAEAPSGAPIPPTTAPTTTTEEQVVLEYQELVKKLPRHHLQTLAFLMHHLLRVSQACEANNMPASNLAIVFGPTIIRHPEHKDNPNPSSLVSLMDTEHTTRCIELLIVHAEEVFGSYESCLPKDYAKYTQMRSRGSNNNNLGARPRTLEGPDGGGGPNMDTRYSIEHHDDFNIPGLMGHDDDPSDSDADAEAIPSFLLPDDARSKMKTSPILNRERGECHIIKASLKGYTGLERVTREGLSTQDSLEASQKLSKQPSSEVMGTVPVTSRKSVPHDASTSASVRHHRASDALFAKMGKAAKKHSLDEDYLSPPPSATGTGHPPLSERLSSDMAQALRGHTTLQHSATTTESLTLTSSLSLTATRSMSTTSTMTTTSAGHESDHDHVDGMMNHSTSATVLRSSTSPATGRTSLTIGIGGAGSPAGRSSSLSEEQGNVPSSAPATQSALSSTSSVAEQRRKFLASSSATVSTDSHHFPPVVPLVSGSLPTSTISNLDENKVKIQVHGSGGAAAPRVITKQASVDRG